MLHQGHCFRLSCSDLSYLLEDTCGHSWTGVGGGEAQQRTSLHEAEGRINMNTSKKKIMKKEDHLSPQRCICVVHCSLNSRLLATATAVALALGAGDTGQPTRGRKTHVSWIHTHFSLSFCTCALHQGTPTVHTQSQTMLPNCPLLLSRATQQGC